MAEVIRMPKMSDTMEEGNIVAWVKNVGDTVEAGDVLAEVETDKATMELEAYEDGILLHIAVEQGAVAIDAPIAVIGEKGDDWKTALEGAGSSSQAAAKDDVATDVEETASIDTSSINAVVVSMPKMSDTMTEGNIVGWLKKEGETVEAGDVLAEVETDKATMELEAYDDGVLLHIAVAEGAVAIDAPIAVIGEKGADYKTLLQAFGQKSEKPAEKKESAPVKEAVATQSSSPVATSNNDSRIKVSPLAKKIANDKGIDLSQVKGSGEHGRIIKRDVENFVASPQPQQQAASAEKGAPTIELPTIVAEESYRDVEPTQMRKAINKAVINSMYTAPHFYVTMEINMKNAMASRKEMNAVSPVKISFNDLVVKAAAQALRQHPEINAAFLNDKVRYNDHISIGVAMAIPDGLVIPVVKFADNKTLSHISAEVKDFSVKAKSGKLKGNDMQGSTFTISNLGMFGVEEFTGIINTPNACILAVGGIKEIAVVENGQIVPGHIMKVTLSCDHRVVDGAIAAPF